ncbi:MAG: PAS domain S-box protein [Rugosibacter sp.]
MAESIRLGVRRSFTNIEEDSAMQSTGKTEDEAFNLFQAIIEQAPDAMIYADKNGTIRVWNRGAEAIFGYAAEEAIGKNLDVIIPERFRRAHWDGFNKAIAAGQTRHSGKAMTTRSVHKNGNKLYVDMSFSLVKDRAGNVMGSLAIGRDSTARHLAGDGASRP